MCGDCVCTAGSSGTAGLDCVLEDVSYSMFFFCCLVCVATVFAVGVLVGLVAWIVCKRILLIVFCFCCLMCVAVV